LFACSVGKYIFCTKYNCLIKKKNKEKGGCNNLPLIMMFLSAIYLINKNKNKQVPKCCFNQQMEMKLKDECELVLPS